MEQQLPGSELLISNSSARDFEAWLGDFDDEKEDDTRLEEFLLTYYKCL